ncbi:hypothetical protein JXA80_01475, partial [bacterium]|nr:hypothetical protein [candidate division CSSED10-310 bacterium]
MAKTVHLLARRAWLCWLLLAAGAVTLGCAFPRYDWSVGVWVALIPLIQTVDGMRLPRVFWVSLAFFTIGFAVSFSWVTHSMIVYGGMSGWMAGVALAVMSGVCGLFSS